MLRNAATILQKVANETANADVLDTMPPDEAARCTFQRLETRSRTRRIGRVSYSLKSHHTSVMLPTTATKSISIRALNGNADTW